MVAASTVADSRAVTTTQILVVVAAVLIASLTQAVAGFGFGLLSVPIMTLAIEPKLAVVISTLMTLFTTSWQAWHGRREADRVLVKRMTIAAYVGMPIGLWVFVTIGDKALRLTLGVAVLGAVLLLVMRINLRHVGPGLDVAAGFASGVLNTSISTNGPPLVFALQARQLPPDRFRSTIVSVFAFSNVASLTLFIAAGKVTRDGDCRPGDAARTTDRVAATAANRTRAIPVAGTRTAVPRGDQRHRGGPRVTG
jgi:uncharacterized protein